MLIVRTVTVGNATLELLVNPDECDVCRRNRADCRGRPWPNHSFVPAVARADAVPGHWAMKPRIPEHEAKQHRLARQQLADVVPLRKETLL